MSGDCPHRAQLENTLFEYQRQTALLATTQSDYLHIIGDLKNELDTLSCQVTHILDRQKNSEVSLEKAEEKVALTPLDMPTTAKDFEAGFMGTLGELEHQNDLLQAALVRATKNREDYLLELEEKNAYLQSHIETMRNALAEKDKLITQQNVTISELSAQKPFLEVDKLRNVCSQLHDAWITRIENLENELDRSRNAEQHQISETRKLNDELVQTKRKNGDMLTQVERLRSLLNDSTENYESLQKKYDALNKSSDNQSKQIQSLDQRIAELQTNLTQDSMETKLLQHQLTTLRQKEAITNGELKALQDRYIKVEGELGLSNEVITKLKSSMHQKEDQYIRSIKRQQDINMELGKSLKEARDQLDKLQKEHKELSTISTQQAETIESYNKWKIEQRKADAMTRESIEKYENHVKLLTEQNKSCLERCRSLHENNKLLTEEIRRLRASTLSIKPGVYTPMTTSSNNLLINRLDRLRQTTDRVLQQKLQFNKNTAGYIGVPSTEFFLPPNIKTFTERLMQQAPNDTLNQPRSSETKSNDSNKSTDTKPP